MDASKLATGFFAALLLAGSLSAQDVSAADPAAGKVTGNSSFGMGIGIGTQLIDGETFQSISFVPDLAFGKFGIGLDVKLNYQFYRWPGDDTGFYVRPKDWIIDEDDNGKADAWNSSSFQKYMDLYLSKIVYARYGLKGDPLYIKLGLFEDGAIGNGFIMNGYSNGLLRPEYSYVGLAFDLDGALLGFPVAGFETFTNSVTGFDILGGRLYVRPLNPLNIPVFGNLQLGVSAVADRDPYAMYRRIYNPDLIADPADRALAVATRDAELAAYGDSEVFIWGIDARQPLVDLGSFFTLSLFGDYVMQGSTAGGMAGFGGNLLFLTFNAQLRRLGPNFQPVYFDRSYDLTRVQKLKTYLLNTDGSYDKSQLVATPAMNNWYFKAGTNLLDGMIVFNASLEGPLGNVKDADTASAVVWPKLRSALVLDGTQVLPVPLTFTGFYDKDFIRDVPSVFSPEDALVGAKLGYQMGAATLQLTYNLKYVPEDQRLPGDDKWEITSKLEAVINLN